MADPILLDKNVITSIARNNKPAAQALIRYLNSGTPVYTSRAAYDELVPGRKHRSKPASMSGC